MTTSQAYHILGLGPGAGPAEIAQAHAAALRVLQLQLVPGTPLAVRQRAQDQIAELGIAFELVKNAAPPYARASQPAGSHRPKAQPVAGHTQQASPAAAAMMPLFAVAQSVAVAGIVAAGIVVLLVVLLSVRSTVSGTPSETAQLRVLSVPWSHVEIDATPLGPSGQAEPFTLKPGTYTLVLRQGGTVLTMTIYLRANHETIVKAQLEKGQINVIDKSIRRSSN